MYEQDIRGDLLYLMVYAGVTVLSLIACCYLLFRRANAIAPDVTPPLRLRRWAAALMACSTLSHLWYIPLLYLTSAEAIKMLYFICALLDFMTVFPVATAVLFTMLQDRRRPLWPIGVLMAPLVIGVGVCIVTHSDDILPVLYGYYLLLTIVLIIYMVRAMRQYGLWLRDNYADLEHKEVWQNVVVLFIILAVFSLYVFELHGTFYKYAAQLSITFTVCLVVWRVETLSDLSYTVRGREGAGATQHPCTPDLSTSVDKIGQLLQRHCIDTQLYLQHDLTIHQLAKAIGTNRYYLSQHFSQQDITYNDYINGLRIDHFVSLYQEVTATHHAFTVKQLAQDSGYRNYTTFSNAFKQRMGKNVTAWMQENEASG